MTHDLKSPPFSVLPSLDCKTPQLTLDPHDPDKANPHKVTKIKGTTLTRRYTIVVGGDDNSDNPFVIPRIESRD